MSEIAWPKKDSLVKKHVSEKLKDFVRPALMYASSSSDRHILKTILMKLTSKTYMTNGHFDINFDHQYLNVASKAVSGGIDQYLQSGGKTSYDSGKKKEQIHSDHRLVGSGRVLYAEQCPEMIEIMKELFDTSGEGLRSHPRRMCETLFQESCS